MYKLLPSSGGSNDFSMGIDHDRVRRREELTSKKNKKGKHHVRRMLKDVFAFVEHQKNLLTD